MSIAYGRHTIDEEDMKAVTDVLRSDYLTQGPVVGQFERQLAAVCGARHAVAVNSATSALHLACLALGVVPGDEVWTSPISFVASANCAVYCGATVRFVDIDRRTFNMSPERLSEMLHKADRDHRLPRVVIPVHLGGTPCEMGEITRLCQSYDVHVLQDASHALGATLDQRPIMASEFGEIAVTSFHPVKMVTTAEGGAAVTSSAVLAAKMERLRSHGITRAPDEMMSRPDGPWYYEQIDLGFNYRMPDLFAALGLSQLRKLSAFVARRNEIADAYRRLLPPDDVALQVVAADMLSSRHLVIAIPDPTRLGCGREGIFERLVRRGINTTIHYIPIYRHPFHAARLTASPECPTAEWYYRHAVTLPCHPTMTDDDVAMVVGALTTPLGYQTIF